MNKIIKKIAYTAVVALGLTSCNSEDVTYTGSQFRSEERRVGKEC